MLISKILLFGGALIREWALIRSFTVSLNGDSIIDAKEFHKLQALYLQVMADVRNVDRKMKVQTEENFQKTILDQIKNLKNVMEQK